MFFIKNLYYISKTILGLIPSQNKQIKQFLAHYSHIDLGEKTRKRIFLYTALCTYLAQFFALLRNEKLTKLELKLIQNLSVLIPLYDDLMDDHNFRHEEIRDLVLANKLERHPYLEIISPISFEILYNIKDKDMFLNLLEQIGVIQNLSLQQAQTQKLSTEELVAITHKKGGLSLQMIRMMCFNSLTEKENEFNFLLGAQFQFINDVFDVYKDRENNIQTLGTSCANFQEISVHFKSLNEAILESSKSLDYPTKNIKTALHFFAPVLARGQVAVSQLNSLPSENFNLKNFTRKELVCDMEKISSVFLNLKFYFEIMKNN